MDLQHVICHDVMFCHDIMSCLDVMLCGGPEVGHVEAELSGQPPPCLPSPTFLRTSRHWQLEYLPIFRGPHPHLLQVDWPTTIQTGVLQLNFYIGSDCDELEILRKSTYSSYLTTTCQ